MPAESTLMNVAASARVSSRRRAATVLLACAFLGAGSALGQSELRWCEVELEGPLEQATAFASAQQTTTLRLPLAAGESARRSLPVAVPLGFPAREPQLSVGAGGGSIRFLGWDEDRPRWSSIAPALRARPWSAPAGAGGGAPLSVLVFAAASALVLARLRGGRAALFALAAAAGVFVWTRSSAPAAADERVVLEGDARGRWLEVRSVRSVLPFDAGTLALASDPPDAAWSLVGADGQWSAQAGAEVAWAAFRPRADRRPELDLEQARAWEGARLEALWRRDRAGLWRAEVRTSTGEWASGETRDPPGWLNPALPQGRPIAIARVLETPLESGSRRETWLRWIGGD